MGSKPKPKDYGKVLVRSAAAIHSVDPNAQVMTAGIVAEPTNAHAILGKRFLADLFKSRAVRNAVDIVAYHPYARNVAGVRGQLKQARASLRSAVPARRRCGSPRSGGNQGAPQASADQDDYSGQERISTTHSRWCSRSAASSGSGACSGTSGATAPTSSASGVRPRVLLTRDNEDKPLLGTFESVATR